MSDYSEYPSKGSGARPGGSPGSTDLSRAAFSALDYPTSNFTWEHVVCVLRKNSRVGMGLFGVSVALIATYVMMMKNVYQPVARIEIAPPISGIRTLHEIESPAESENQDYLETQTQILRSDALAISVIRQLRLDKSAEFLGRKPAGDQVAQRNAATIEPLFGGDKEFLREQTELATLTPSEALALGKFRESLSVDTIRNTRLVAVSFADCYSQN